MINSPRQPSVWELPTGTVIRVRLDWYDHVALLGDRLIGTERSVLAFSANAGGFIEQPYSEFAQDRKVTVEGYLGNLAPEIVMQRARAKHGQPYSWASFNCEHFVRHAHGVTVESPQVKDWAFFASCLTLLACAAARA